MLTLDTDEGVIDAPIDKVKKHHKRSGDSESNNNEDHNNDKKVDIIISRLLPTPSQTDSSDDIGPDEFAVISVDRNSHRKQKKDFIDAMDVEVSGLEKRYVWDVVSASDVPSDRIVLGGTFDLVLKGHGTLSEKTKVRFVAHSHKDREKHYIVHDTAALRAS